MPTFAISTYRLLLRPVASDDVDEIHRIWIDPGVRKYLWDDEIIPKERASSVVDTSISSFHKSGYGLWVALLKDNNQMIGFCGYFHFHDPPELEILYGLHPDYWKSGFAVEMTKAMLCYGFTELLFDRVNASTDAANEASVGVMKNSGMKFLKREETNGLDTIYYSITKSEFEALYK